MANFIFPLEFEKILVQVLSGTPEIFTAISIIVIMGMAGYFRMKGFSMFFMLIIFMLMFTGTISASLVTFVTIFGALMVGYIIARIIER